MCSVHDDFLGNLLRGLKLRFVDVSLIFLRTNSFDTFWMNNYHFPLFLDKLVLSEEQVDASSVFAIREALNSCPSLEKIHVVLAQPMHGDQCPVPDKRHRCRCTIEVRKW